VKLLVYFYGAKQILHHDQRRIFSGKAQWIGLLAIVQYGLNSDPSETCLAYQNQGQGHKSGCYPVY
jgi:hypothetical protein